MLRVPPAKVGRERSRAGVVDETRLWAALGRRAETGLRASAGFATAFSAGDVDTSSTSVRTLETDLAGLGVESAGLQSAPRIVINVSTHAAPATLKLATVSLLDFVDGGVTGFGAERNENSSRSSSRMSRRKSATIRGCLRRSGPA